MKTLLLIAIFSISLFSKSFIWEVSDGDSKLYLLGSVHIANEEMYPLANVIEDSYKNSDALVLEVVIDKINPFEMMGLMMIEGNKTLKDLMDSTEFANIKAKFDEMGVPEMSYIKLKPWAATLVLMQQEMANSEFKSELGFDTYFLKKARSEEKEVLGLETVQEQLGAFEELSDYSNEFLKYSLKEFENSRSMVDKMLAAWKAGDTKAINDIINMPASETKGYEKVIEVLLNKRNYKMQEKIETYLKENKQYFVVVGAGHLVGDKGLLNLLSKNKKYKLKQL